MIWTKEIDRSHWANWHSYRVYLKWVSTRRPRLDERAAEAEAEDYRFLRKARLQYLLINEPISRGGFTDLAWFGVIAISRLPLLTSSSNDSWSSHQ